MLIEEKDPVLESAILLLKMRGEAMLSTIKEEYWPLVKSIFKALRGEMGFNVYGEKFDSLDKETLIAIAKRYKTAEGNAAAVLRRVEAEGVCLYVTYVKDRELLTPSLNKYVIISTKSLDEETSALFADSDLILMK